MKRYLLAFAFAASASTAHGSCGTAFCSVNTQWDTQGLASNEGLRIDLRYSYAKADQFRAGSSKITPEEPSGSDEEIEDKRTINQILDIGAEYTINPRWNIELGVPVVMRDHSHTFDSSVSAPFSQEAKFDSLGDVRVVAKYKLDLGSITSGSGVRVGVKLPTGAIDKTMTPPDPADPTVPYALERSSQPGTGSTDAILGAYYFRSYPDKSWGWFANAQAQSAVSTRDNYRPGRILGLDLGVHRSINQSLTGLLQLNAQHRARDSGSNANPASGGYSWNLSPGLSYELTPQWQVYGFVQVALKQYANPDPDAPGSGQLTAPWSVSLGVARRF